MRRPSLEDILAGRRAFMARRTPRRLTRAQRRAMAPREPRGAMLRYLRAVEDIQEEVRELVEAYLVPALPEAVGEAEWAATAPPEPTDARTRVDAQGCPVCGPPPGWYADLLEGFPVFRRDAIVFRRDAIGGKLGVAFGMLELAITERISEDRLARILSPIAEQLWEHSREEMSRVLQIDLRAANVGLQGFVQEFLERNVRLIRSVSFEQLGRMEEIVGRATGGQVRVEVLRDELMRTFKISKARAALIARDQTLKANAELAQLRQQQVGVEEYIWTSSGDERVRGRPGGKWEKSQANHWILDGTRQSWLRPPVTNPRTGARNHPGMDYQCRCTAIPIVDHLLEDEEDSPVSYGGLGGAEGMVPEDPPVAAPPEVDTEPSLLGLLARIIPIPSRSLAVFRGAYAGATPEEVDLIATGQMLPKNARVNVFPPIRIEVEPGGQVHLTDGNHRLAAAREAGATRIRALIRYHQEDGTVTEVERIIPIGSRDVDLSRQI